MTDALKPEPTRFRALALDDDPAILLIIVRNLARYGFEVETSTEPQSVLKQLAELAPPDLLICDVDMPAMSGLEVITLARSIAPTVPIVMLTGDTTADTAVQALRLGAFNYMTKTHLRDTDAFAALMTQAATYGVLQRRAKQLEEKVQLGDRFDTIIGDSEAMQSVYSTIERVAPLDVSVLILGESGTGKELVARAIHNRSSRRSGPFVALNCGALPETLVDSELFGHVRGAFTGAVAAHAGAFERASGGTLFLDEIGDVPPSVQLRLLRVLQESEVQRLGGTTPVAIDVRIIAATLVDLEAVVENDDGFRPDLYYRLNVVSLHLPPLRHRVQDIPLLLAHLLDKHSARMKRPVPSLAPAYLEALMAYRWPGNVRELENAVQSSLALGSADRLDVDALPTKLRAAKPVFEPSSGTPGEDELAWSDHVPFAEARQVVTERFERDYFVRLLRRCDGNLSEAARQSGLDRSNLRRSMSRCGVKRSDILPDDA